MRGHGGARPNDVANGIKVERIGKRFTRDWLRSIGISASDIFDPFYFNQTRVQHNPLDSTS